MPVDAKRHSTKDLAAQGAAAHARYVVVAGTLMWGFVYYSTAWNHFHVSYLSAMELIDAPSGEVILKAKWRGDPRRPC